MARISVGYVVFVVLNNVLSIRLSAARRLVLATAAALLIPGGRSLCHAAEASVVEAVGGAGGGALGSRWLVIVVDKETVRLTGLAWRAARARATHEEAAQRTSAVREHFGLGLPAATDPAGANVPKPIRLSADCVPAHGGASTPTHFLLMPGRRLPPPSFSCISRPRQRRGLSELRQRPGVSRAKPTAAASPTEVASAMDAVAAGGGAAPPSAGGDGLWRPSSSLGGGIAVGAGGVASAPCSSGPRPSRIRIGALGPARGTPV